MDRSPRRPLEPQVSPPASPRSRSPRTCRSRGCVEASPRKPAASATWPPRDLWTSPHRRKTSCASQPTPLPTAWRASSPERHTSRGLRPWTARRNKHPASRRPPTALRRGPRRGSTGRSTWCWWANPTDQWLLQQSRRPFCDWLPPSPETHAWLQSRRIAQRSPLPPAPGSRWRRGHCWSPAEPCTSPGRRAGGPCAPSCSRNPRRQRCGVERWRRRRGWGGRPARDPGGCTPTR
mmetsp:Transcript_105148/g.336480  ORF Transcript_105148/g.336480 Transcript_105148/m.336480 type:complete len:235 (-) Transcript_105148:833-1537(-)